jgi:hypothetical protein
MTETAQVPNHGTWHLARALCWRSQREQGWLRLLLVPLGFGALLVAVGAISFYVPGVLTGPTRAALKQLGTKYFGSVTSDERLALAFLLLQAPALLALAASMTAASIAQNSVGTEAARGTLEQLAGAPVTMRSLFEAVLTSVFVLTVQSWLLLACTTLGVAAGGVLLLGGALHLPASYWLWAIALPVPLALWASAISLYLSFRFPSLLEARTGTINVGLIVPMLPAVSVLLLATLRRDIPGFGLSIGTMIVSLVGTAICVVLVGHRFRTETVLAS